MIKLEECIDQILNWYLENKRDLPWRKRIDPYHVWISEIMLQQTRVEAVISYYHRFLEKLPTIWSLASVPLDTLLKLWEGLGYYNRAKNLKLAAEVITEKYHGVFPNQYDQLIQLPGIGEYTASAISSICFQDKKAVVDGNVLRVYTRFYNDHSNIDQAKTRRKIKEKLEDIIPEESGDFNQALMEIGEVICIPNGTPKCQECPLRKKCLSNKYQNYSEFPVKEKKRERKVYHYTVFVFYYQNKIGICKRQENLLKNLWQFPNICGNLSLKNVKMYLEKNQISYKKIQEFIKTHHLFTHQKWELNSYIIELDQIKDNLDILFLDINKVKKEYAMPTVFSNLLEAVIEREK